MEVLGVVGAVVVDFVVEVVCFVVVVEGAGVVEGTGSGLEVVVEEDFFSCLFKVFCCNLFHHDTVVWWWGLKCFLCEEEAVEVVEGFREVVVEVVEGWVELD